MPDTLPVNQTENPNSKAHSVDLHKRLEKARNYILSCQQPDGAITWFKKGKLDPWDHVEAAMGLSITGEIRAAENAFSWLAQNQNLEGSWFAKYFGNEQDNCPDRQKIEAHFVAYIATGVWQHYLITRNDDFLFLYYPTVEKAINFIIDQQHQEGDVQWAQSAIEDLPKDALLTACSSILKSLQCAIHISNTLQYSNDHWQEAYNKLRACIRHKPQRFDRTWEPKTRFSMDWFYPILSGVYTTEEAVERVQLRWHEFVEPNMGCRCVSNEPWMTVAETCELIMSLVACNKNHIAQAMHQDLYRWQDKDGGFWTGYNFKNNNIWPEEKTSWTAAAFILSADAIYKLTPAADLFTSPT